MSSDPRITKLKLLTRFASNKDKAILDELFNIIDQFTVAKGDKGEKGDTGEMGPKPIAGVDYPIPQDGKDGKDGRDGLNGKDGRDGVDGKDGQTIRGPIGEKGEKGEKGDKGDKGKDADEDRIIKEVLSKIPPPFAGAMPSGIETPIKAGSNVTVQRRGDGIYISAQTATGVQTATDSFTTTGGVQIVTLSQAPTAILMVIINGQPQNRSDYSNVGTALTINLPDVPAGLWMDVLYNY